MIWSPALQAHIDIAVACLLKCQQEMARGQQVSRSNLDAAEDKVLRAVDEDKRLESARRYQDGQ